MARLRTADLAKEYRIPKDTWPWWRHRGERPKSFKLGRTVFDDEADVAAWVASQKVATAKGEAR